MKQIMAIIAALFITGFTGFGIFAIGSNAYLNTNTVPIQNSPGDTATTVITATVSTDPQADATYQAQIKQLQDLITQYQTREKQYQSELSQAAQRLSDANSQAQQYQDEVQQLQNVLVQLQQRGVIRINQNGQILIPSQRGDFGDSDN